MRENIKKLFSLFLCLAMAIGLLPMAALAAEPATTPGTVTATKVASEQDTDGNYTITMTAKGTPYNIASNADVVLVVDNSGSMASGVGKVCDTPKSE